MRRALPRGARQLGLTFLSFDLFYLSRCQTTPTAALPPHPGRPRAQADLERLSGPAIRAFFKIAERWGVSGTDQQALLGGISRSTLQRWKRDQDALLTVDQLERISYLLGIHKNLQILLPTTADGWVKRPNAAPIFGGRTALELMVAGGITALREVRLYLDGQAGGWA